MTTIVATRTLMVSDSRISEGNAHFHSPKLFRSGDSILGLCGDWEDALKFLEWFNEGADLNAAPDYDDNTFDALELNHEGLYAWDKGLRRVPILNPYYAVGSGAQAALGALYMGATPAQAIEAASLIDLFTSGPLQQFHLLPKPMQNDNPAPSSPTIGSSTVKTRSRKPKGRSDSFDPFGSRAS
jgi:hypothetical protein